MNFFLRNNFIRLLTFTFQWGIVVGPIHSTQNSKDVGHILFDYHTSFETTIVTYKRKKRFSLT